MSLTCWKGAQGFGLATSPTLEALIYDPSRPAGSRFTRDAKSTIPRLYHSVSTMLLDGDILVSGSNPVDQPILQPSAQNPYVTEFRIERWTPGYLSGAKAQLRPTNILLGDVGSSSTVSSANQTASASLEISPGGSTFAVSFDLPNNNVLDIKIVLYYNGFVTHSLHMGMRMVYCDFVNFQPGSLSQRLQVSPPPTYGITPPGYYALFVVADGVPSIGQFVMIK